jgi:hypothetical protein
MNGCRKRTLIISAWTIAVIVVIIVFIAGLGLIYEGLINNMTAEIELRITKTLVDANLVDMINDKESFNTKETFIDPLSLLAGLPGLRDVYTNVMDKDDGKKKTKIGALMSFVALSVACIALIIKFDKSKSVPTESVPTESVPTESVPTGCTINVYSKEVETL